MDLIVLAGVPDGVEELAAGIASVSPYTVYRKSIQDFIKTTTMRRYGLDDNFWKTIEDENEPMYEFGLRTASYCYEETEARGRELDKNFWARLWLEALEYEAIALPDNTQVIFDNLTHEDDLDYLLGNFGHNYTIFAIAGSAEDINDKIFSRGEVIFASTKSEKAADVLVGHYQTKIAKRVA